MILRKAILKVGLLICSLSMLSGCDGNRVTVTSSPFTTIAVAVRSGEQNKMQKIVDRFSEENPSIKIKFIELGRDFEQYRLISAALSTEEYLFDIVEVEDVWVDDLVKREYITPVNNSVGELNEYLPFVQDSFRRGENVYALPLQIDIGMLLALKKYNWDGEFSSITDMPDNADVRIYDDSGEETICSIMELIKYTDNNVNEALRLYRDIYFHESGGSRHVEEFREGQIPIMRALSSVIPSLRNDSSKVLGDYYIFNTPESSTGKETSTAKIFGLAVSSLSRHKEMCGKFLEYCGRDSTQTTLIKSTGMYPVKQSLYSNPIITSEWTHILPMEERINNINIRPHIEGYAEASGNLQKIISGYLSGSVSEQEAADCARSFVGNME